jgi:hypothetical protein
MLPEKWANISGLFEPITCEDHAYLQQRNAISYESDLHDRSSGLKSRRKYTGEFKAHLVIEYLKGERTLAELAAIHQVHPNQIKNWKSILFKRAGKILEDQRSGERS